MKFVRIEVFANMRSVGLHSRRNASRRAVVNQLFTFRLHFDCTLVRKQLAPKLLVCTRFMRFLLDLRQTLCQILVHQVLSSTLRTLLLRPSRCDAVPVVLERQRHTSSLPHRAVVGSAVRAGFPVVLLGQFQHLSEYT